VAQERTFDVAELIEGKTLNWPQISVALWLCTLMVLEGYDMQTLSFAAPAILREWHVSRADFGFVLSAHLVGYLFGALTLSLLGDRIGRKMVILAGATIFGIFTFGAGFAASPTQLYLWRFCAGFGLGGAIPTGIALAAEYMPARIRATTIGLMFVGYNVGAGLGGFIAAWTVVDFGWPSVFFIGGLAAIPMLIGLAIAVPESIRFLVVRGGAPERVDAIARWLRPGEGNGATRRYVVNEERRNNSPKSLFIDRRAAITILLWLSFIMSFLGHYVITAWMPTVLTDDGLSIAEANMAMGSFQFGGAIGSFLIAFLLDRVGIKIVAITFLITVPIVIALGVHSAYPLLIVNMILGGIAVLGGQIGLNALSGTLYPTYMRATGAGWGLGIGRFGSIMGPIIAGQLIGLGVARPMLLLITSIPFFFCALALFALNAAKNAQDGRQPLSGVAKAGEFAH
jgi:AAHS family 4-hydroxybenzoate transporter-like MFS transporter